MLEVGTKNEHTREIWIQKTLQVIPRGSRILDAGAGEQRWRKYCAHLKYVSQDFAKYDGIGDNSGLQTGRWDQSRLDIVCDITSIPESDASFDAIMCIEVFEHLPEPIAALNEFTRLLRPGGQLILTAPFCSLTHFAPYHFYTGFSRYFYETHLPAYGIQIDELLENGNYFEYMAQEIRRTPTVARRYTSLSVTLLESLAMRLVLYMLDRFSKNDSCSAELLSYGCFVKGTKK
ncbi:MAG: class I SAM-dependent methyltransferase [Desulfuromonadaceae bacterium]|nr:class I SAM-dependent methyltransferase [Desulfuromonadaceae bacterium]MDD2854111.1 class I SAM-dependent methyltransferase [Desulfuromonadaceae bacterium]